MIAPELFSEEAVAERVGLRAGRLGAQRRRRRTRALRYREARSIVGLVAVATLAVVIYLGLLDHVTQLNYQRVRLVHERAALLDETERLDDRLSQLDSREHLAHFAGVLNMHEAATFRIAVVPVERPVPVRPPSGLAFLAGWLR